MTPNNGSVSVLHSEGMLPLESSGSGGGGGYVVEGNDCLKKGPWTAAEDQILMEYVRKHGEGNWNEVQRNSGLNRCGKSGRLRWANHLRPNLKKGSFSLEEQRLILELHAKYGNKWARMASQLPGRTDNEIKNHWNTRVKRKKRQGLPLYPHDIKQSQQSQQSHFHSQTIPSLTPLTTIIQNPFQPITNGSTPTFSFTQSQTQAHHLPPLSPTPPSLSPLSSPHRPKPTALTSFPPFDPINSPTSSSFSSSTPSFAFHRPAPILGALLHHKRYLDSIGFSPPLSPNPERNTSMFRTSSMPDIASFQLTGSDSMPDMASFQMTSTNSMSDIACFEFPRTFNHSFPPLSLSQFDFSDSLVSPTGPVYSVQSELSSNQVSQTQPKISIDNNASLRDVITLAAADETHSNISLLDEFLQEACSGGNNSRSATELLGSFEEKHVLDGYGQWLKSTSSIDGHLNSMPEDLSKLSNSIPPSEPVSNWYSDSGEVSNAHSSGLTDASLEFEMQQMASMIVP